VLGREPRGRWEATSLLATMTVTGMTTSVVVPGPVDRRVFDRFIERHLIPTLTPGQIVVLDNLSVHRSARAGAALAAVGCEVWFLPRYSPDRNPIEQAFAKLKAGLRRAQARSFEAVVEAVGDGYGRITVRDAAGFIRSAGYSL
jgi:transposase